MDREPGRGSCRAVDEPEHGPWNSPAPVSAVTGPESRQLENKSGEEKITSAFDSHDEL